MGKLSEKTVVITGASSGLGATLAVECAKEGAQVAIFARNGGKLEEVAKACGDVRGETLAVVGDVTVPEDGERLVAETVDRFGRIDYLINNAGVMIPPYSKTKDGFELQMGTNHLGHFALTMQLLDLIKSTSFSRIVNVSSGAHRYGNIDFEDLTWEKRKYKPWRAYGDSKIANLYFTHELQKKLENDKSDVKVTAAHPGWTATELQRHSGLADYLNRFVAMTIEQGALPTLRAATDEDAHNGDYFGPDGFMEWRGYPKKVDTNKLAKDETIAKKLWSVSEKLTKVNLN